MKGAFLKTYVALAVLGGLFAYYYFWGSKTSGEQEKEQKKEKVFALDKSKVKELALAPSGGEAIRLVREGTAWKLAAPAPAPADSSQVDSLLGSLESLEMESVAEENPKNAGDFGLAPPKLSVSAIVEGAGQPFTLLLGDEVPAAGGTFARLPSNPRVFIVPSWSASSFNKKPFDLRDRDLLKVKRDAVKALEVTGPAESFALERSDKGEWGFMKPIKTLAGRWSVDGLLGTLESLKMESVAAEDASKDLKKYGLDKPQRTVKLTLADGGYKILEIGSAAGEKKYHAREAQSPLVAVIPGAVVDDLAKGMKELRAKRLADVSTFDVEAIEAQLEGKGVVLARTTSKGKDGAEQQSWKKSAPEKKDADKSKVEDALFKLTGLEVQEFVDKPQPSAAYGLDAPVAKLTLKMSAGKPPVTLEIGKKDAAYYSRRPGDDAVLKLDTVKVEEALKALKEL